MPTLSIEQVEAMLEHYFRGATVPFQQPVKNQDGWKIMGLGNMTWCAYVISSRDDQWPTILYHPFQAHAWYTYQLDSRLDKLCKSCHQPTPSVCRGYSRACRVANKIRGLHHSTLIRQEPKAS